MSAPPAATKCQHSHCIPDSATALTCIYRFMSCLLCLSTTLINLIATQIRTHLKCWQISLHEDQLQGNFLHNSRDQQLSRIFFLQHPLDTVSAIALLQQLAAPDSSNCSLLHLCQHQKQLSHPALNLSVFLFAPSIPPPATLLFSLSPQFRQTLLT